MCCNNCCLLLNSVHVEAKGKEVPLAININKAVRGPSSMPWHLLRGPGQEFVIPPSWNSFAKAWEWSRQAFVSVRRRWLALASTFSNWHQNTTFYNFCYIYTKKMLFFCRLKINHMQDAHTCVFILGLLAGTRTVTAKKSLRDCVPRGFPYVSLCKVTLNHAIFLLTRPQAKWFPATWLSAKHLSKHMSLCAVMLLSSTRHWNFWPREECFFTWLWSEGLSPFAQGVWWPPEVDEEVEDPGLELAEDMDSLLQPRQQGQIVQVGVQVLG